MPASRSSEGSIMNFTLPSHSLHSHRATDFCYQAAKGSLTLPLLPAQSSHGKTNVSLQTAASEFSYVAGVFK